MGRCGAPFVAQAAVLAAAGGLAGALFGAFVTYLFQDYIISRVGVPFLFPGIGGLVPVVLRGVGVAVFAAAAAALVPSVRAALLDPAEAMRE